MSNVNFWDISRGLLMFFSGGFSILVAMLLLNIITISDLSVLIGAEHKSGILCPLQELLDFVSGWFDKLIQLFNKIFKWVGIDADFSMSTISKGIEPVSNGRIDCSSTINMVLPPQITPTQIR